MANNTVAVTNLVEVSNSSLHNLAQLLLVQLSHIVKLDEATLMPRRQQSVLGCNFQPQAFLNVIAFCYPFWQVSIDHWIDAGRSISRQHRATHQGGQGWIPMGLHTLHYA